MLRNRQAPSRASPQTLCQKCLKKDNYECKATIQDRPYQARPSRSQQLANPKLMPKLSSDRPNALMRKEGIADEQLAKAEAERDREKENGNGTSRARSTSVSSVSTISTRGSPSPSREKHTSQKAKTSRKRRRGSSSSESSLATSNSEKANRRVTKERNMRRRHSSTSPIKRGRNLDHESSSRRRESSSRHG